MKDLHAYINDFLSSPKKNYDVLTINFIFIKTTSFTLNMWKIPISSSRVMIDVIWSASWCHSHLPSRR